MRPHVIDFLSQWMNRETAVTFAPTWFTFAALAGIVASALVIRDARRSGDHVPTVITSLIVAYVAAVSCGILIPLGYDLGQQLLSGHGVRIRWPGMVSYCGFLGAVVAVYWLTRKRLAGRLTLARFGDLVAAPACIAVVFARLGCFTAGCDYGKVTSVPWAMRFPSGSPAWADHVRSGWLPASRDASLPVHPTQLYEALLGVILFVGVRWLARQPWARQRQGRVFMGALAGYAVGRWIVETFRGDAGRGLLGPVSSAQLFSVLALLLIGFAVWRSRRVAAAGVAALMLTVWLAAPRAAHAEKHGLGYELGLLYGTSISLNRRGQQVPQLGGAALSLSWELERSFAVGLDLSSMVNSVATHDALMFAAAYRRPITPRLDLGVRGSIGFVWVDFDDRAFEDVRGGAARAGLCADWYLGEHVVLMLRPLSVDLVSSEELGGPILSYQFRIGIGFRSRARRSRLAVAQQAPAPPPPQSWPVPPPPAQPQNWPVPPPPAQPPQTPPPAPQPPEAEPIDPYGEPTPPSSTPAPEPEPVDPYADTAPDRAEP